MAASAAVSCAANLPGWFSGVPRPAPLTVQAEDRRRTTQDDRGSASGGLGAADLHEDLSDAGASLGAGG